jgi:hypothetical protein
MFVGQLLANIQARVQQTISRAILDDAKARRNAMTAEPTLGKTPEQVWSRIEAWRNA